MYGWTYYWNANKGSAIHDFGETIYLVSSMVQVSDTTSGWYKVGRVCSEHSLVAT